MGLDWRPINRPKPGFEREFEELFHELLGTPRADDREAELQQRFWEISTTPYETLDAPCVGVDGAATEWAMNLFRGQGVSAGGLQQKLTDIEGFYVLPLVEPCDGLPMYVTPAYALQGSHIDTEVFRAKFLDDCREFLGDLYEEAFQSKLARDLDGYGQRLMVMAEAFAAPRGLSGLKEVRETQGEDGSEESAVHIAFSAAKWCLFWSCRGHGLWADS